MTNRHFERITGSLKAINPLTKTQKTISFRFFSNDLSARKIRIFTEEPLLKNQIIELNFSYPLEMTIKGKIIWSNRFEIHRPIYSALQFPYRTEVEFQFTKEAELNLFIEFFKKFRPYINATI